MSIFKVLGYNTSCNKDFNEVFFMKIKNLKAFTLAEVLIALLIIGIIATIILPTLLNNIKKAEYSSKLKKFYSTMSHAISLSELENGEAGG